MCIFSGAIEEVAETNIFARLAGPRQFLVYEMRFASASDVAMILPLPVKSADESAVSFINLARYADFFAELARCFPRPLWRGGEEVLPAAGAALVVHRVGAFDASFVPSIADFDRLDPRFRLPSGVWAQLPEYASYGFAVFQLRAGGGRVHPMAFSFETRRPDALYFPTTHVHDERVHATACFDHALYAQGIEETADWLPGQLLPADAMTLRTALVSDRSRGIVEPEARVYLRTLGAELPNGDVWV